MVEFGVHLPQVGVSFQTTKRVAQECERVGFQYVWLTDHLLPIIEPARLSYLECWTTLSALAETTSKLRLGTMVLCNLFRHPSVLAKMAATLDVITGGRLELGIGAGWFKNEFDAYGIPYPKAPMRIAMLREALDVIKKMWLDENPIYQGEYYNIDKAWCNPKPIQKPHPPIWIGTLVGGKLMYETIAKYADGWAVGSWYLPSIAEYRQKVEQVRLYCSKAPRDFGSLKKGLGVGCIIAEDKKNLNEKIGRFESPQVSVEGYETTPKRLCGTPEECAEILKRYVEAGADQFMMDFPDVTDLETIRLFGKRVIPLFEESTKT